MDDFIEVRKEFIKKFGRKYTLRKSLAVPVQLKPKD